MTKKDRTRLQRMLEKGLFTPLCGLMAKLDLRLATVEKGLDELVKLHQPAADTFPKEILLTQDALRKASMPMLLDLADACKLKVTPEERVSPTLLRAKIERYAQKRGQLLEPKLPVSDPHSKLAKEMMSTGKKRKKKEKHK